MKNCGEIMDSHDIKRKKEKKTIRGVVVSLCQEGRYSSLKGLVVFKKKKID